MTAASVPAPSQRVLGGAPAWVAWVTFPLALIGVGISTYLTITHFEPHALVCTVGGPFNCGLVTTSWPSRFLGVPVAFLGLFQYVMMAALCSPKAWSSSRREIHLARLAFATVGMAFVLWLLAAELLIIKSLCLWCTGVHIVTFALFICVVSTVPAMLGWTES